MTKKIKLDGVEVDAESARKALAEYDEQQAKNEELFHGYTMEQWKRIIDGRYAVETRLPMCSWRLNELAYVRVDLNDPFVAPYDRGLFFKECRPAQRYGVLIPHFG